MSDYIEREKLIKALEQLGTPEILAFPEADWLYRHVMKAVRYFAAADVKPVVRCWACKYSEEALNLSNEPYIWCHKYMTPRCPTDTCECAEGGSRMIKCSPDEIPCCDFCIHCIHATEEDEYHAPTAPIGCGLYNDEKHNNEALMCGYCNDFHCFRAGKE